MNAKRTVEAFLMIGFVDLAIYFLGTMRTVNLLRHILKPGTVNYFCNVPNDILTKSHERAIQLYPRHIECLQRAAALFVLLKLHGQSASFHIGIRKYPFASHAWVERNGAPSSDDALLVSSLTPVLTLE